MSEKPNKTSFPEEDFTVKDGKSPTWEGLNSATSIPAAE